MKRSLSKVGLLMVSIFIVSSSSAGAVAVNYGALSNDLFELEENASLFGDVKTIEKAPEVKKTDKKPPKKAAPKPPTVHIVKEGETLTDIAKKHKLDWTRIYDKNLKLENPNILTVSQKLVIPKSTEKLKKRSLPAVAPVLTQNESAMSTQPITATYVSAPVNRGSSSGNTYAYGYCTWYAKNRRPDLPNNLGNADTWVSRASAQGIPTGSTPRVGAIGQQGMHVVYVEKVHGDGTITVSEMNYAGWNQVSSRRASAGNFMYIY